jgi:hypothetical protein
MSGEVLSTGYGVSILRFRVTADDMISLSDLVWRDAYRRMAVIVLVVAAVISAIGVSQGDVTVIADGIILAGLSFVLLWSGRLRRLAIGRLMRRRYAALAGDDEFVVTLTPGGIRTQQGASTTLVAWADVTAILEDEQAIVLLKGRSPRLMIPKHAFATVPAVSAFREALIQRMNV